MILGASPKKAPVHRVGPTLAWRGEMVRKAGTDEKIEAWKKQLVHGETANKWSLRTRIRSLESGL